MIVLIGDEIIIHNSLTLIFRVDFFYFNHVVVDSVREILFKFVYYCNKLTVFVCLFVSPFVCLYVCLFVCLFGMG